MKKRFISISSCCFLGLFVFQACNNEEEEAFAPSPSTVLTEFSDPTTELITDWSNHWVSIDQFTDGMRPNSVARSLAYIHLAGYETAVPFMDNHTSTTQRFDQFNVDLNQFEEDVDLNIALNEAYGRTIDHFMIGLAPAAEQSILRFRDQKFRELSQGLSNTVIENSRRWGRYVASRVIDYSRTDNAGEEQIRNQTPASYVAPVGEGLWEAGENEDAWFPYWREVRTFIISPDETSTTDFASLLTYSVESTSDYYASMTEVYEMASDAMNGGDELLWIAEFWADDVEGLMISPPGRQFSIANQLIGQFDLSYAESLELLLKLGFAINDAAVSAWDDKYTYNTERPTNFINEHIDPNFTTNLARFVVSPNPAFPSYPSGHATFAGAAGGVFIDFFETDNINFTDRTYAGFDYVIAFNGSPRTFSSFSQMAYENAFSRVPLGVHIQEDSQEGLRLGYEIADAVNALLISN
ncbi:MAG: vanadium-dependent haloperoxidase [Bacteroidota bacterium]